MPWKSVDLDSWAEKLGIDINELRQKDRLIDTIVKIRKQCGLSQAQLADLVGVSQSRIAQIENRLKIGSISFDVLLGILHTLGHEYRITIRRVASPLKKRAVSA